MIPVNTLIAFAHLIDRINQRIALIATWLVLLACVVSAGNAVIRYAFNLSSNAWLELQWYMFAGIVMLGAAYVLKMNEHVRVDVLYTNFTQSTCSPFCFPSSCPSRIIDERQSTTVPNTSNTNAFTRESEAGTGRPTGACALSLR